MSKLTVRNVYKIFGANTGDALKRLEKGETKEQIFAETGLTVGVQDANFTVKEGEIFVIMGLSGSGKSTLVRMLNGLIKPSSGEIVIDGEDVASAEGEQLRQIRRTKLAMVFQHFALFPHKTVVDNVAYGLKIKGIGRTERRARALEALGQVGLEAYADTFTDELSGGMQQRVGLARGLATNPDILLMDEPFGALDPLIRREMQGELLELQRSMKKTIIFITHDLDEALILGDRIAIMKDGVIVQIGTARQIVDEPADEYVSAFTQNIDRARVLTAETAAVEPEALTLGESTVGDAMRRMEELDRDALYVVKGGKPVGVVTYRDLAAAGHAADALLDDDSVNGDFPTVARATLLRDLYAHAGSGLPIGIVDGKGRLIKVVETRALFEQIASVPETAPESPQDAAAETKPQPPIATA